MDDDRVENVNTSDEDGFFSIQTTTTNGYPSGPDDIEPLPEGIIANLGSFEFTFPADEDYYLIFAGEVFHRSGPYWSDDMEWTQISVGPIRWV